MKDSLYDLFEDEYGNLDFRCHLLPIKQYIAHQAANILSHMDRRTTGVSKANQVKVFVNALTKVSAQEGTVTFTKAVSSLSASAMTALISLRKFRNWAKWHRT